MSTYKAADDRYESMPYNRCGKTGLRLPAISLGLWHNFGGVDTFENSRAMLHHAFDKGITHFDLANNYGPPPGSAEETFGEVMKKDFMPYRDEMIISTKAGYHMWEGPYGEWGSRKYMIASLNQSLKRMDLEYVDIFYSHRFDPNTPLEETMGALDTAVRSGKALYAGISNYPEEKTQEAARILKELGTPCIIHQAKYSMLNRWVEPKLAEVVEKEGMGMIAFSPLGQGLLTDRYLDGIPADSRVAKDWGFLSKEQLNDRIESIQALNIIAKERDESLAEMAISWLLNKQYVTSVLIGASSVPQIDKNLKALKSPTFSIDQLTRISTILDKTPQLG